MIASNSAREEIESLLEKARQDVRERKLTRKTVVDLLEKHAYLDKETTEEMRKGTVWDPSQPTLAIHFLRDLKQTIKQLQSPTEAAFLLDHHPSCKTVAELVKHMSKYGLTFGPVTGDKHRYYVILHNAIAKEARKHDENKAK